MKGIILADGAGTRLYPLTARLVLMILRKMAKLQFSDTIYRSPSCDIGQITLERVADVEGRILRISIC